MSGYVLAVGVSAHRLQSSGACAGVGVGGLAALIATSLCACVSVCVHVYVCVVVESPLCITPTALAGVVKHTIHTIDCVGPGEPRCWCVQTGSQRPMCAFVGSACNPQQVCC